MDWAKYNEDIQDQIEENIYYASTADDMPNYSYKMNASTQISIPVTTPKAETPLPTEAEEKSPKKRKKSKKFVCKDCGETYTLTASNIDFFEKNGLHLPLRCEACRAKRRTCATKNTTEIQIQV